MQKAAWFQQNHSLPHSIQPLCAVRTIHACADHHSIERRTCGVHRLVPETTDVTAEHIDRECGPLDCNLLVGRLQICQISGHDCSFSAAEMFKHWSAAGSAAQLNFGEDASVGRSVEG